MKPNPSFAAFTWATTGREPFPWQDALATRVIEVGWPDEIGVPTGLGKTACIDIAIWAISAEAEVVPTERVHPSRVWYVVNRRLLVDEGASRAMRLSRMLQHPEGQDLDELANSWNWKEPDRQRAISVLVAIAERLKTRTSLGQTEGPLHIGRLRGGVDLGQLPSSPAQPAVLLASAPMFGSRLLFRGYGSSRFTRSLDAAYAGTDSLVLLDEAHLSRQLSLTVEQLSEADAATEDILPGSRSEPRMVALTATGERAGDRFDLGEQDLMHPLVVRRINAKKPTRLVTTRKASRAGVLATAAAEELQGRSQPAAAVIFSNTAGLVPAIHKALLKATKGVVTLDNIVVLTGRLRGDDAAAVRQALLEGPTSLRSGRDRNDLLAHRVVIATQTLEVGADLDFDVLITESAGVRALTQRLGRLNRLGEATTETPCVIVHADDQTDDPVYGAESTAVWERLKSSGVLDLGPLNTGALGEPADQGARSPELLPNHLDEYVKTTDPPFGEAPVDLFINGIEEHPSARVTVAWRTHLPQLANNGTVGAEPSQPIANPGPLVPGLRSDETVEVPIGQFRDLLKQRDLDAVSRLATDRISVESVAAEEVRPGDQLILNVADGGYDDRIGWDVTATGPVTDLSARLDKGRIADGLLLEPATLAATLGRLDVHPITADALIEAATKLHAFKQRPAVDWRAKLVEARASIAEPLTDDEQVLVDGWQDRLDELDDGIEALDLPSLPGVLGQMVPDPSLAMMLVDWLGASGLLSPEFEESKPTVEMAGGRVWSARRKQTKRHRWASPAADAYDELSLADRSIALAGHLDSTGMVAERFARDLGVPERMVLAVGNAGRLHDLGKTEPRFQAWLGADAETPAAKSRTNSADWRTMQKLSGWPSGGRHELLSVRVALAANQNTRVQELLQPDPDLVLHLVASHHGRGRPGLFGVPDAGGATFAVDIGNLLSRGDDTPTNDDSVVVSGDLATHDLEQPIRFREVNERYGRRAVALLECIVRQADWAASAAAEREEL